MIYTKDKFNVLRIWPGLHQKLTYGYIYTQHFSSSKDGGRRRITYKTESTLTPRSYPSAFILRLYTPLLRYAKPAVSNLSRGSRGSYAMGRRVAFCATGGNHPVVCMNLHSRRVVAWNSTTSSKYWQLAVTGTGKSTHTAERQARVRTLPGLLLSC